MRLHDNYVDCCVEALQAGLVSSVVDKDLLEKETTRIAMRICEKSREVIILGKKFLRAQAQMNREQAYRYRGHTCQIFFLASY